MEIAIAELGANIDTTIAPWRIKEAIDQRGYTDHSDRIFSRVFDLIDGRVPPAPLSSSSYETLLLAQHSAHLMMVRAILKFLFMETPNQDELYRIYTQLLIDQTQQPPYTDLSPEIALHIQESGADFLRTVFSIQD
ncbi:MAG: hypothetical protein J4G13_13825 [Dehalococcoidia bacterium]|nr:hypothetical protein [Dehalococcoidia bacterium]